jgi:hypothetical protein
VEAAGCRVRSYLDDDFRARRSGRRGGLATGTHAFRAAMDIGVVRHQWISECSVEPDLLQIEAPDYAMVEVAFLWASILSLIIALYRRSVLASGLLVPYLVWVSIAAVLNYEVVVLNGPFA